MKISPQIQLMLQYPFGTLPKSFYWTTGIRNAQIWDVLVKYNGNIMQEITSDFEITNVTILNNGYAIMKIPRYNITQLATLKSVEYIEFPEVMQYIIEKAMTLICGTNLASPQVGYGVTGKGIFFGSIDSGVDYTHPDFLNADGTTRIAYLWDQTIAGNPPQGFNSGTEFTSEQINQALLLNDKSIVPSVDNLGHGTALAGVAVGNGAASDRTIWKGVAPEATLIVVKVGQEGEDEIQGLYRGPRNIEIMMALKYITDKALQMNKPVVILLGFGVNEGGHNGGSALEQYINYVSEMWRVNVVVGTGNQANKDSHTSGDIITGERKRVGIFIDDNQPYYFCTLWKSFVDAFGISIISPSGERTPMLTRSEINSNTIVGDTIVSVNFSTLSPTSQGEQILIFLDSFADAPVEDGNWFIEIEGLEILDGEYDIWGESFDDVDRSLRFLQPVKEKTLTIPSTSVYVTSVAASASNGLQIASFSGWGYIQGGIVKPDITAPGVDVVAPTPDPNMRYQSISGTSVAASFVAGAYLLMLEFGINQVGDEYLYGDILKAYLLRSATRNKNMAYPNTQWGYGELCIRTALREMSNLYDTIR
ncbi:MAG: hypothetical protein ATN35_10730 [Epulopiscium sp. Nele67-Bin004]|nr:MAG: hypothetical protein ATN35_10730 [Epulopiscium sp. Nele67-Bin004]